MGIFVHVKLPDQDRDTTSICQINKQPESNVCLTQFFPLFPKHNFKCYPSIPQHSYLPQVSETGSQNIELYRSTTYLSRLEVQMEEIFIQYPAFTFTTSQLSDPANSWLEGLKNVCVVRYKQDPISKQLVPVDELEIGHWLFSDGRCITGRQIYSNPPLIGQKCVEWFVPSPESFGKASQQTGKYC